ncbi:hypothetical protein SBV1_30001 [Verrucomicrobia bacterium]|nr:hypothetical protein SBV1_30001 [Verrucomicrobiota bacterium]
MFGEIWVAFEQFRKIWQIRGVFAFSFFSQNPLEPKAGLPTVALAKVGPPAIALAKAGHSLARSHLPITPSNTYQHSLTPNHT